jgi:hypothetical protein
LKEITCATATAAIAKFAETNANIDALRQMVQSMAQGLTELDFKIHCQVT